MDWREAKEQTLNDWLRIRDALSEADAVKLVTDLNAVCALCDKAREAAGSAAERCSRCIAFGDTKVCEDYRLRLSELILDEDRETADVLLIEIIQRVREAPLPERQASVPGEPETAL